MQSFGYIYLTTNSINSIGYIGQSCGLFKPSYRGSGRFLLSAIAKYGKCNFRTEIIEWCDSKEELNQAEVDHIAIMRAFGAQLYNLHVGGIGFHQKPLDAIERIRIAATGRKHSPETIAKMSAAKLGKPGRPMSAHHKERLIAANTGSIRSDEAKAKMRAAKLGKPGHPLSEAHKAKLSMANKGKVHTPETIEKFRAAKLGKKLSDEHKNRISASIIRTLREKRLSRGLSENKQHKECHVTI